VFERPPHRTLVRPPTMLGVEINAPQAAEPVPRMQATEVVYEIPTGSSIKTPDRHCGHLAPIAALTVCSLREPHEGHFFSSRSTSRSHVIAQSKQTQ
jgi:hypothetical protein